jgi:hypothetical protein
MYRTVSAATFFDLILVLATGVQAGVLGACTAFLLKRRLNQ